MHSEGLLVLTDDGVEQHRITDPRHKLPKLNGVAIVRPQRRGFAIRGCGRNRASVNMHLTE